MKSDSIQVAECKSLQEYRKCRQMSRKKFERMRYIEQLDRDLKEKVAVSFNYAALSNDHSYL